MEDVTIKAIDHKSRGILSELLQVMIQKLKKKDLTYYRFP
jgi:hypothetical protein